MSLDAALAELPLVDQHCHGVVTDPLERAQLDQLLARSVRGAPTGPFDSPLGTALRRWCAPVLGLPPHCSPEDYARGRAELGREASAHLMRAARLEVVMVDAAHGAKLSGVDETGELAGARAREVACLEGVVEQLVEEGVPAADYPERFAEALHKAARWAVALKGPHPGGPVVAGVPPREEEVAEAARRLLREGWRAGRPLDPVLARHALWAAAELAEGGRLPLLISCGHAEPGGDPADPSGLAGLLRTWHRQGVTVVLVGCYPYHRQAANLAAAFPDVYFDVGSALSRAGPGSLTVLAEALEIAPFSKQLYGSAGLGLAELHYLGAHFLRTGLARVLSEWVKRGECTLAEAQQAAQMIAFENARRVYRLEG